MVSEKDINDGMGANVAAVQGIAYTFGENTNFSPRLAQHALQFQKQSIYDLKQENSYDYAICSEVIEYIEDPLQLLNNVYRAIRKFAIITKPNGRFPDGSVDKPGTYDCHVWTPETFAELLSDYNYEFLNSRKGTISIKLYKELK